MRESGRLKALTAVFKVEARLPPFIHPLFPVVSATKPTVFNSAEFKKKKKKKIVCLNNKNDIKNRNVFPQYTLPCQLS